MLSLGRGLEASGLVNITGCSPGDLRNGSPPVVGDLGNETVNRHSLQIVTAETIKI